MNLLQISPEALRLLQDRIVDLEATNADLLKSLRTIKIVNASSGPLKREIIDDLVTSCERAVA